MLMFPFDLNLSGKQKLKLLHKSFSVFIQLRCCSVKAGKDLVWHNSRTHSSQLYMFNAHPDGYLVLIVRNIYFILVVVQPLHPYSFHIYGQFGYVPLSM